MRTVSRPFTIMTVLVLAVATAVSTPAAAQDAPGPLVTSSSQIDLGSAPVLSAASPDGRMLYVVSSTSSGAKATLSWIDPTGPRETRTAAIGARPTGLAVAPGGTRIATSSASDRFVRIFDASSGRLVRKVQVGGRPDAVVIGPKGKSLFASINRGDSVVKIDMTSLAITGRYPVKDRANSCHSRPPISLAVTADSATLLVSCGSGGLFVLRTANGKGIGGIDQADGGAPVSSPDGTRAYWGDRNELWGVDIPRFPMVFTKDLLIDADGDAVDVIDRIRTPVSVTVTPDGSKVYAAMPDLGSVTHVDPVNLKTPMTRIAVNGSTTFGAQQLALDPAGARLFITTTDGRLITVDTATDAVIGIDPLPFAAAGPRAATRIIRPIPLTDSRLALGWTTYDGPGGPITGSGITVLTLG